MSLTPWNFSGGWVRDLQRIFRSWMKTVISPVRVRLTGPSTPTMSPRSSCSISSHTGSGQSALLTISWMRPVMSWMWKNLSLPLSLASMMRPATRTVSPSTPFSAGAFARASRIDR